MLNWLTVESYRCCSTFVVLFTGNSSRWKMSFHSDQMQRKCGGTFIIRLLEKPNNQQFRFYIEVEIAFSNSGIQFQILLHAVQLIFIPKLLSSVFCACCVFQSLHSSMQWYKSTQELSVPEKSVPGAWATWACQVSDGERTTDEGFVKLTVKFLTRVVLKWVIG